MHRRRPDTIAMRAFRKVWCVTIEDHRARAWVAVRVERPTLREAVEVAVTEAEHRWPPLKPNIVGPLETPLSPMLTRPKSDSNDD
jgi:hypothetical protein